MDFVKISNILIAILGVNFVILIHELGHYFFSKLNGVKVEELSMGFGKKLFSYRDSKGTLWSLRVLPLGAFVKNKGDADATSFSPNTKIKLSDDNVNSKKPIQKFLIAIAGPLFNFILSFVIIFGLYFSSGKHYIKPEITAIAKNSLAEKYLKNGDIIKKINNLDISDFRDIRKSILLNNRDILNLNIERNNETLEIKIPTLKKAEPIGISGDKIQIQKLCIFEAIKHSIIDIKNISIDTLTGFKMLIKNDIDRKNIGGPLSIVKITVNAISNNFYSFLMMIALISVNLGIINLLPIPIVDGGQALIHIIEIIIRRDLTYSKFKKILFYIGYGMVGILMLFAFYNDITKMFF